MKKYRQKMRLSSLVITAMFCLLAVATNTVWASGGEKPHKRVYKYSPPAPESQSNVDVKKKSDGCESCHSYNEQPPSNASLVNKLVADRHTMHITEGVVLGCTDCHGGDANVFLKDRSLKKGDHGYLDLQNKAHVLPLFPERWSSKDSHGDGHKKSHSKGKISSANPKQSFTLLNEESPEYVRFINPSDYRVVRESCGSCHLKEIQATERSLMSTGAMLWGGASYNNGILPFKKYQLGEFYTCNYGDGKPRTKARKSDVIVSKDGYCISKEFYQCDANKQNCVREAGTKNDKLKIIGGNLQALGSPKDIEAIKRSEAMQRRGILTGLYAMPTWEVLPPGDVFRIFERGGRNITNLFPETGLPNPLGLIQRLEEPGRPDVKQSNRGAGTGARIAVPVINIHKTRLNDPFTWFLGSNDQPGDYRSSGCASCHVVYANDRDPRHSSIYAKYGHDGKSRTTDPTISKQESGHPLTHTFTKAIPSSLCMNCHMHQPNVFVNSYLGYTMWDYESNAPSMWPKKQKYASWDEVRPGAKVDPSQVPCKKFSDQKECHKRVKEINERNPEEAAIRGKWGEVDFLKKVWDDNSKDTKNKDTQFADYHGHGWNFRAIYKRDRDGTLLDQEGKPVSDSDPKKFQKAVHMSSIHLDVGMQCTDCHYSVDSHGSGHIVGEVAQAVEIDCVDCHGTAEDYPSLRSSGPAAPPKGTNLRELRNHDGRKRFEWKKDTCNGTEFWRLYQRSMLDPSLEWEVALSKNSANEALDDASCVRTNHDRKRYKGNKKTLPLYNAKSARAKTMHKNPKVDKWGTGVPHADRAHKNEEMTCFSCHSSWATSCAGCHLPIQANWKTKKNHYEGNETRNYATYNPQVVRDQMFQLGRHGPAKGGRIAPIRSSSALILSSKDSNRQKIYIQQPPVSSGGFSSQAFAPHFPHTTRRVETKTCTDCHISEKNDNNAIMSQLLLQGTNFVNFVGHNTWVGAEKGVHAVTVTEWEEPQAVIGSYLHKYAYPDWYNDHKKNGNKLKTAYDHKGGYTGCLQLRGEYLYAAEGKKGMQAYDVANIANKGFSQRFITAPYSKLAHNTHIPSSNATCVALPTNQPIHPDRQIKLSAHFNLRETQAPALSTDADIKNLILNVNQEQRFFDIYNYAFITDAKEGLILVDVNTLSDGELRNNVFKRKVFSNGKTAWNENNILKGARHITIGGYYVYIAADAGLVILNLKDTSSPKVVKVIEMDNMRASAVQFKYLFVTDAKGFHVIDLGDMRNPVKVPNAFVPMQDAQRLYVARTYAYVAGGKEGLVIIDVETATAPKRYQTYTAKGKLNDARDIVVASTNASLMAYIADGRNGLKVLQLTSPDSQPKFYGFSPAPKPELIATYATSSPALSLSKGLDRDRAVDETGGQIAVFGRLGSRPFTLKEMNKMYLDKNGKTWTVTDKADKSKRIAK